MSAEPKEVGACGLCSLSVKSGQPHRAAVEGRLAGEAFARLGEAAGHPAAERRDFQPVALKRRAPFEIKNEGRRFTSANVVAQVPGSDPARAGEVVM